MAGIIISKASGLNDGLFGKVAAPIRSMLQSRAEAFEQESNLKYLFKEVKSENFGEMFTSQTALGDFEPVGEAGAYPTGSMQEGFRKLIEAVTWKNRFSVTQEMVEDNKIMDISNKANHFTKSYYRTREVFGFSIIHASVKGTSYTYKKQVFDLTGADGKALFAADHPSITKVAKAQSNKFANEFNQANLGKVETAMQNFVDDNGNKLNIAPDTIVIANNAEMKDLVFGVVGSEKEPTVINKFNYQYGRWNIIVSPYLEDASKEWYLLDSSFNEEVGGLIDLQRVPLTVKEKVDDNNDNLIYDGRSRFNFGFNDWRAICVAGVTGATTIA